LPGRRVDGSDTPRVRPGPAVRGRPIYVGAQPLLPPGHNPPPGPWFDSLFVRETAGPCTQGGDTANRGNESGIVFFAGCAPLYRDGVLIGGLGVSGDGVEQDEVVTNAGLTGFDAPDNIKADNIFIRGARLPDFRFHRNP